MAQSPLSEVPVGNIRPEPPAKPQPSDLARIAKNYPKFDKYLELKIAQYQQFHPTGTPIEGLTEEERMKWWGPASVIVKEFSALRAQLASETRKR